MINNQFYESTADELDYFNFHYAVHNLMPAHFHNNTEFLFVNKGKIRVIINGVERVLDQYDIAISNSFDIHYYDGDLDSEVYILVYGSNYKINSLTKTNYVYNNFLYKNDASKDIFELVSLFYKNKDNMNYEAKTGFVCLLYGFIEKLYPASIVMQRDNRKDFVKILQYIAENYFNDLNIDNVAKMFGYTKNHFSMLFNKYTAMHFRDYINRIRIEKISEDFRENPDIPQIDIISENGFNSLNTYYRAKKKNIHKS